MTSMGVQKMSDPTPTTKRPSAYCEAVSIVLAVHGPLSERELEIAQTAARASYRWASREIIELLQERVKNV